MIILGIDPGLNRTGYGVIQVRGNEMRLVEGGVVTTSPKYDLSQRVLIVYEGVSAVIRECAPDAIAIEALYSSYKNPRTAILMAHARGVISLAAAEAHVLVNDIAPARVKRSLTGSGRASKEQVAKMVQHILNLDEVPKPNDLTDALALAIAWRHLFGKDATRVVK